MNNETHPAQAAQFITRTHCITCEKTSLSELSTGKFVDEPLFSFLNNDPWGKILLRLFRTRNGPLFSVMIAGKNSIEIFLMMSGLTLITAFGSVVRRSKKTGKSVV